MIFTDEHLNSIYDRTDGKCHLCWKRLAFINYGISGAKGAWHVEHSVPKARGGTNRLSNLYAGCVPCNLTKGVKSTRSIRARHGRRRAPLSRRRRDAVRTRNVI